MIIFQASGQLVMGMQSLVTPLMTLIWLLMPSMASDLTSVSSSPLSEPKLLFDELFDSLVDFEICLQREEQQTASLPITANAATRGHHSTTCKN